MNGLELFFIAVGLSMDAFAVSLCKGLVMDRIRVKDGLLIALFFGGFQGLMPLLGFFLADQFAGKIEAYDHWVAFILLVFIGGKMLYDVYKESHSSGPGGNAPAGPAAVATGAATDASAPQSSFREQNAYTGIRIGELTLLAIATSIDALAVGVAFAVLPGIHIAGAALFIGCVTFILSFAGVALGFRTGRLLENKAQILGGLILIAIGCKILLEHTGIIG